MLECPSCRQALPPTARFCTRCGVRLLTATITGLATIPDLSVYSTSNQAMKPVVNGLGAHEAALCKTPAGFSQRTLPTNDMCEPETSSGFSSADAPATPVASSDVYAQKKRELAEQCVSITASMESLLPFVYENHRAENQALFASTLAITLPLDDPVWGRVAFVLGAYGNYMYRYPLQAEQKLQVWRALLWAVFYERCYRRKYLAQRFQQILHFFQGVMGDTSFQSRALEDLQDLSAYLEPTSLKKLLETLQLLPDPPASLLELVNERLVRMLEAKQEKQLTQVEQQGKVSGLGKKESGSALLSRDQARQSRNAQGLAGQFEKGQELPEGAALSGLKTLTNEVPQGARAMLSFLTDAQIQEFFVALRTARLEIVDRTLRDARLPLLKAQLQGLRLPGDGGYLSPRRPIRLGKKHADRFLEACRLLESTRVSEQQAGLRLFEQGARETTHPDYAPVAREWMLYARAIVQGSPRVVGDWESAIQRGDASWEEIWNLAFFYQQTGYPAESLRVLKPGLDELRAPVTHLQLGLLCGLRLLLEPGLGGGPAVQQVACAFLLAHLERWPHPLSCLTWLLLAQEARGPLHPRQQAQRLSTFQELLEHPLTMPDPQKDLSEARVAMLEDALVGKAHCEDAWFLWINDYAERHLRKYQAWARLAETSERLDRLKSAEMALQHLVEIQYQHDYARYQEGTPQPRADYLRRNLEKLFEFYQRHNLVQESEEAFLSCYPSLSHLWDAHEPANRRLITLTRHHQMARQQNEVRTRNVPRENAAQDLSTTATMPLEHFAPGQRVGIFVDYENIARFIPHDMDAEDVGKSLASYGSQFGEVVCLWASASPQNLSNLADVRTGLEAANFKVRFPRRELQFSTSKKNLADFALLECLSDAQASEQPDIYLIVSGDRDYYERVWSLLDAGHVVRVIAAADSQHLSLKYRELEQQRAHERQSAGYDTSDFFIDNLEEILCPLMSFN